MNTKEVAKFTGVHKDTLLRWLRQGLVSEPGRDRHGWREFTSDQAEQILKFAHTSPREKYTADVDHPNSLTKIKSIDWDFVDSKTNYLTHSIHPYPAKFIPQIPNVLIQELSSFGDTVLDPFCGSGTTLVEALLLKRQAIGIDANPIACLISQAKTVRLSISECEILKNLEAPLHRMEEWFSSGQSNLFEKDYDIICPESSKIPFWFERHVITELAYIKALCNTLPSEACRTIALTAFSSIIVSVSKQDSDTRYVRKEKHISKGDTIKRFQRALYFTLDRVIEFGDLVEPSFKCNVIHGNILEPPNDLPKVDLVVCSPPYPNAYSYHLYHMTRMLWLDMDPAKFKKIEIGSHRKYSNKGINGASIETFKDEMQTTMYWLSKVLKPKGYCCFVIGDSTLHGVLVHNSDLLSEIASSLGYSVEANIVRNISSVKKSFNPKIGKIRQENILILRNGEINA
jgi:DNA modification methylase